MLNIATLKRAENMMCLEFDLEGLNINSVKDSTNKEELETVKLNRKFRVITQEMTDSTVQFRLSGECHGQNLFAQNQAITFNINGKKLIKSIQDRILSLKSALKDVVQACHPEIQPPPHILYSQEKLLKFYLNNITKLNKNNQGPWITQTKKSILVKLCNYQDKSIAIQISMPELDNLPDLMSNFNQIVLQEFVIEKLFICFDMPLSALNKHQA
jgi:hypothetical protein